MNWETKTASPPEINSIHRCARCRALMTTTGDFCRECVRSLSTATDQRPASASKWWGPLADLGIPLDFWILAMVVVFYLTIQTFIMGFTKGALAGLVYLLPPVAMIVFADTIGGFRGFVRMHYAHEAPPSFVKLVGWFFLLSMMARFLYDAFQG